MTALRRASDTKRAADPAYRERKKIYNSARWARVRRVQLAEHPFCVVCKTRGFMISAEIVDHVKDLADGGDAWDACNLQSLCKRCHASKTARTRPWGKGDRKA